MKTRWVLVGLVGLLMVGCASPQTVVRTRHSRQFGCGEEQVTVTELGGNSWLADGCGRRVSYYCKNPGGGSATCIMESAREGNGGGSADLP